MSREQKSRHSMLALAAAFIVSASLTGMLTGCGGSASEPAAPSVEETNTTPEEAESEEAVTSGELSSEPEEVISTPAVVPVQLEQTYSTDEIDVTFVDAYWDAADEEGYWTYIDTGNFSSSLGGFSANAQLFIVRIRITNKYTSAIKPSWGFWGQALVNDKYEYEADIEGAESGGYEIAPLETREYYVYVAMPEAMKDQFENITFDFGIDPKAEFVPDREDLNEVYELYFEK